MISSLAVEPPHTEARLRDTSPISCKIDRGDSSAR